MQRYRAHNFCCVLYHYFSRTLYPCVFTKTPESITAVLCAHAVRRRVLSSTCVSFGHLKLDSHCEISREFVLTSICSGTSVTISFTVFPSPRFPFRLPTLLSRGVIRGFLMSRDLHPLIPLFENDDGGHPIPLTRPRWLATVTVDDALDTLPTM